MNGDKIETFMRLAGQQVAAASNLQSEELRKLGAQLLLSEVLEYVIKGLGLTPQINGVDIVDPNQLDFKVKHTPNQLEMLDGLADTAYTMYWNAKCFGVSLEEAFELVCDNNLEKFVRLDEWSAGICTIDRESWDLDRGIAWPIEVTSVCVVKVKDSFYAVGKDSSGKVRKPSTYSAVDLSPLILVNEDARSSRAA